MESRTKVHLSAAPVGSLKLIGALTGPVQSARGAFGANPTKLAGQSNQIAL